MIFRPRIEHAREVAGELMQILEHEDREQREPQTSELITVARRMLAKIETEIERRGGFKQERMRARL